MKPKLLVGGIPGMTYENVVALVAICCEKELLPLLPSDGTEMVTVLLPTFGSDMPA